MIQPIYTGRLGNVMFEIATAVGYSLKHGIEYNSPTTGNGVDPGTIERYLSFFPNIKRGNEIKEPFFHYEENGRHEYNEIPYHENIKIDGFFQSEKYFKEYRKEIVELFSLPKVDMSGYTSIHVRRGDYVKYHTSFPPVTDSYLRCAIRLMNRNGFRRFMVFSDDIPFCKASLNSIRYQESTFEYSEGKNEFEDLYLGASCEHNIISNSTFSWWQAWLNENPNKLVVSPSKVNWFGKRVKLRTDDIIPPEWAQITF